MKDFKHPTSNPGFDIELNEEWCVLTRKHRAPEYQKGIGEWNAGMYTYGVVIPFFSL